MPASTAASTGWGGGRWRLFAYLAPILLVYAAFLLFPYAQMLRMSLNKYSAMQLFLPAFTLDNYRALFSDGYYVGLLWHTVLLGLYVTFAALALGYPLAVVIASSSRRWRTVLMTIVLSPLMVNLVVRSYAWLVLLGDRGVLNRALMESGVIATPLPLTGNLLGVVIALTHIGLPLMVLSLVGVIGTIDGRLMEAAEILGASRARRFWRVSFPLSLPGIGSGSLLVFCLTVSAFVTPQLLGGGRVTTISTTIYQKFTLSLNWPLGSALVFVLLLLNVVLMTVHSRVFAER